MSLYCSPKTSSSKRDAQDLIDQHGIVRRAKMRGFEGELPVPVDFGTPAER